MRKFATLKSFQKICLIIALVSLTLVGWETPVWAEPTPVTPSTAAYEIEHAKSPEEVGKRLNHQSQAYKQELKKSPTPIPNAAKNATEKTKSIFQLFSRRTQETLNDTAQSR